MHQWKGKKSFHKGMSQWFSDEFKTHFKLLRNCLILRLTLGNLWCFQNSNVWQRNVAFFALISYKPPIAKWIADMGGKIKDKSPRGKKNPTYHQLFDIYFREFSKFQIKCTFMPYLILHSDESKPTIFLFGPHLSFKTQSEIQYF